MTHYNTSERYPQTRAEVAAADTEMLVAFMGECPVEPADPDECLACYAYMVVQKRSHATARRASATALHLFREYRYRVGRAIHDLGGYRGLAEDLGPLGDEIEAALTDAGT